MIEKETLPIRKLDRSREHEFSYMPEEQKLRKLASDNEWKKLKIDTYLGKLLPRDDGWELKAHIKGIVTLRCVISDAPIHHILDLNVRRVFLFQVEKLPKDYTLEEDFDYDIEEMPRILSLDVILSEEIWLDIPDYPKLEKYQETQIWKTYDYDEQNDKKNPFDALKKLYSEKKD